MTLDPSTEVVAVPVDDPQTVDRDRALAGGQHDACMMGIERRQRDLGGGDPLEGEALAHQERAVAAA